MSADTDENPTDAVHPFYRVTGDATTGTRVQAGWITDTADVDYLTVDMTDLPANRVEQAFALAFRWYVDQLNALAQNTTVDHADTTGTETEANADD